MVKNKEKGMSSSKNSEINNLIKIIYFDEVAASDYVTIQNGGKINWTKTQEKTNKKSASAKVDGSVGAGFQFLNFAKAAFSGEIHAGIDNSSSKLVENIFTNALLTDYISLATTDEHIKEFKGKSVYVLENSLSQYKMVSSIMDLISAEQFRDMGINIDKLNDVILGEKGYYQMLLGDINEPEAVLRFNISAFKNNYGLSELSKMDLHYFAVKVGTCTQEDLKIENEFNFTRESSKITAEEIVEGEVQDIEKLLQVYDVVLAGVSND